MFIGEFTASVDDKGRVAVPVKFRGKLGGTVVITRGLDQSLFVYTLEEWKVVAEKFASLPITTANSRAFSRLMLAGAVDVEMDKQGRVMLPDYLKTFAKIGKKIVFAGLYNRIEVWSEDLWKEYKEQMEKDSSAIAEQLSNLGV